MRRIITFTILALTVTGGVALADHRHDRRGDRERWDRRSGGVVVRDSQWRNNRIAAPGWQYRRHHDRRPVYVNNGYYQFRHGPRHAYARPVIHRRYYDYRVRPQVVVENYQPVSGYLWVSGQWQWNGYEWQWVSGHYDVDPNCNEPGYDEPAWDETRGNYYPQY